MPASGHHGGTNLRASLVAIAILVTAVGGVFAAFEPASYPQYQGALVSIAARMPESARVGDKALLSVEVTLRKRIDGHRSLYLYLIRGGAAYHVEVIRPKGSRSAWEPGGKIKLGPYSIAIPKDLAPGDYSFRVGMYGEKTVAEGRLRITGARLNARPLIITTGCFTDKYGTPHYWHINKAHTLVWDGEPFIPAGGMFIYDRDWNLVKAQLDLLKKYGVKNIYLHLGVNQPYVWKDYSDDDYRFFQQTIDYLDENGFTYGIEFQALEAKGHGYGYPGGGPGVDHIKTSGTVRAETKEPRSGVFVVVDNSTGKLVQTGEARVVDGKFLEADVVVPKEGDYRALFAADRAGPDGFVMYYWDEKYQNYVKKVRDHYSKVKLGPGFRFLADPLWNEMNTSHDLIPSAPAFAEQFAAWLKSRYGTIGKLNEAWGPVEGKWPDFEAAGTTISIERVDDKTSGKLMQYCYSRGAKRFFAMEACASQFNYDVREFIGRSLLYYCNDIANVFKQMNDVPVIYKCFTDVDWWHINDTGLASGHDGLGMESYGNGEPMLLFMAVHAYGECEQAAKTTWIIVTETGEGNHQDASLSRNKSIGYTDRLRTMYANYNALISGGAKGIYQFNMIGGRGMQDPWSDNLSRDPRQLEWLATYDRILANAPKLADYRPPLYFRYPAHFQPCSMELYSEPCGDFYNVGGWWWREPIERSVNNIWIVPSFSLAPDAPMFIVSLEKMPATARFARELTHAIEIGKRISLIGFRKDLCAIPAVDRYYTGRFAVNERGRQFQVLEPSRTSRILNKTAKGEVWNLIDGSLQINSEEVFGKHGYAPDGLVAGSEKAIDPYNGVFSELLGVTLLDLGPNLVGFTYKEGGVPVTVISARKKTAVDIQTQDGTECFYADGRPTGTPSPSHIKVDLEPADKTLVRAKHESGPEGIMIDSMSCTETVIVRNLDGRTAWLPSVIGEVDAESDANVARLPETERDALRKRLFDLRGRSDWSTKRYVDAVRKVEEEFYSSRTPYTWIEGEKPISHNFNYASLGGISTLSGNGYLGLETAVEPPGNTGWYATYRFDVPKGGVYQLWLRENYLSFSSPSSYRVDSGAWVDAPNTFVPRDIEVSALYNAVEDERQIFAWYHYGQVELSAGWHTITFRVDKPRPKGTVLTMADDRPYAKLIDCLLLTQRGFVPDGKNRPHYLLDRIEKPMVNLLPNSSVEFDSDKNEKCDGWTPSEEKGLEWTKPGWGNVKLEGLFDINCGMKDAYAEMRALKIAAGERERFWSSERIELRRVESFEAGGWVRTSNADARAFIRVQWLDADGKAVGADTLRPTGQTVEWREISGRVTRPAEAVYAVFECVSEPGSGGTAWFDDLVLATAL